MFTRDVQTLVNCSARKRGGQLKGMGGVMRADGASGGTIGVAYKQLSSIRWSG
jgi:hypothetical protein